SLQEAARLQPGDATAQYNLAVALGQGQRLMEARAALEHALQIDPNHAKARAALNSLAATMSQVAPPPPMAQPMQPLNAPQTYQPLNTPQAYQPLSQPQPLNAPLQPLNQPMQPQAYQPLGQPLNQPLQPLGGQQPVPLTEWNAQNPTPQNLNAPPPLASPYG